MTALKSRVAIVLVLGLVAIPARAQQAAMRGAGTFTCADFGKLYAEEPEVTGFQFFSWAQGFMAGRNVSNQEANRPMRDLGTDIAIQEARLRSYCDEHPLKSFMFAVTNLYQSFPEIKD